jgi:hypothetical protein
MAEEPPWRQVAAQVVVLERLIEAAAARMGPDHVLELRYESLCSAPGRALEQIRDFLGSKGFAPARRAVDLGSFEPSGEDDLAAELGPLVGQAIAEYSALPASRADG